MQQSQLRRALRLYLVGSLKDSGEKLLDCALSGGVTLFQLREKGVTTREYLTLAYRARELTARRGVPLIINDRADIALACGADGVHLGGEDLPVSDARRILGEGKIIGATAKTVEAACLAQAEGADYLGCGAFFPSATKPDAIPMTPERYREILARVNIPTVAIGGITAENLSLPLSCGADGVALSGALLSLSPAEAQAQAKRILYCVEAALGKSGGCISF